MTKETVLHVPIVGGGDLSPTLQTLDELMENTPAEVLIAVWINQKNGKVEYKGKMFEESERYLEYSDRNRHGAGGNKNALSAMATQSARQDKVVWEYTRFMLCMPAGNCGVMLLALAVAAFR